MTTTEDRGLNERLSAAIDTIAPALVAVHGTRSPQAASGVVWSAEGIVVTTHSGTWNDEGVQVSLASGDKHPALVLGRDPTTDLLVLQVSGLEGGAPLPVPERVGLDELGPGKLAIAVGRVRDGTRASWGPISELSGPWASPLGGRIDGRVVVDASLPRGLTGGPLVDIEGRLIGVNTRRLDRGGTTLPVATVDRVVAAIQESGSVRPGWLGVAVLPVALPAAHAEALGQEHGLIVLGVEEDGPAAAAGWLQGDVLVRLGEQAITSPRSLKAALGPDVVDTPVAATLVRAGESTATSITPAARPEGVEPERRRGRPWGHHHGHHGHWKRRGRRGRGRHAHGKHGHGKHGHGKHHRGKHC